MLASPPFFGELTDSDQNEAMKVLESGIPFRFWNKSCGWSEAIAGIGSHAPLCAFQVQCLNGSAQKQHLLPSGKFQASGPAVLLGEGWCGVASFRGRDKWPPGAIDSPLFSLAHPTVVQQQRRD